MSATGTAGGSSASLVVRVAPPVLFGGRRAGRLVERNIMVYRRVWLILVSGFFEPLFYLLSIGVGIGKLVGDVTLPNGQAIGYTDVRRPGPARRLGHERRRLRRAR